MFFGRAGTAYSKTHIMVLDGGTSFTWPSTSLEASSYYFDLDASKSFPSYSDSRALALSLRCLVNSTVGEIRNRKRRLFGRAGDSSPRYFQFRDIGANSLEWPSVASTDSGNYRLSFNSEGVSSSNSVSRAYGHPLRCLVNSTVGE